LRAGLSIRAKIARPAVAILPVVAISVPAILERTILTRPALWKTIVLPVLTRLISAPVILALPVGVESGALEIWLGRVRSAWLARKWALLLRERCSRALGRRRKPIRQRAIVVIVIEIVDVTFAGRTRLAVLGHRLGSLRGGNDAEIVLGVLEIVFRRDRISARVRITRELKVLLRHVLRVPANFDVWAI
jgi:hypothetical protein